MAGTEGTGGLSSPGEGLCFEEGVFVAISHNQRKFENVVGDGNADPCKLNHITYLFKLEST